MKYFSKRRLSDKEGLGFLARTEASTTDQHPRFSLSSASASVRSATSARAGDWVPVLVLFPCCIPNQAELPKGWHLGATSQDGSPGTYVSVGWEAKAIAVGQQTQR